MSLICPKCQAVLTVESKHLDQDVAMICSKCRTVLKMNLFVEVLSDPGKASNPPSGSSAPGAASTVLISIDGEGTREIIKELLVQAGFNALEAASGKETLSLLKERRPAVVLIDVGLPDILGPQLCETIKGDPDLKRTIVILVASLYDKSAKYRREPISLYGAEDYIERHMIQKDLIQKITKHVQGGTLHVQGGTLHVKDKMIESPGKPMTAPLAEPLRPTSEEKPIPARKGSGPVSPPTGSIPSAPQGPKEHEDAKRLARIIISDIILYNRKKVDEGIRKNTLFETLKDEIEEGRNHYNSRVSEEIRKGNDYYREAIEDFIQKRKQAP